MTFVRLFTAFHAEIRSTLLSLSNIKNSLLNEFVSDPRSEWRRMDRGPKHGIINDSYGVHEEEIIMFEMNGTKVRVLNLIKVTCFRCRISLRF